MWLAIAQPSSSMKCRNASAASRTDRFRARNGYSLQAAAIQIVYCCTLCKPGLGALHHCSAAKSCRLHVGEELTHLRFQTFGLDRDRALEIPAGVDERVGLRDSSEGAADVAFT